MKQVITIDKQGGMFGLDHKRKGLDLARFGLAAKERVSDIQWNEKYQRWFIKFLKVPVYGGWPVDSNICVAAGIAPVKLSGIDLRLTLDTGIVCFADYEDAVAAEVAILQGLQKKGIFKQ